MAKNRKTVNYQARWNKGRGQGLGEHYKPWLTVRDVPSTGRSHRVDGRLIKRTHHLLSDLEKQYFLLLNWSPQVVDIREQYPLWPLESSQKIATEIGIRHPSIPGTSQNAVLTTDFLITVATNGEERWLARAVKYVAHLEDKRVIEKLEIERMWWQVRGVDWGIVTEHEIPSVLTKNLEPILSVATLKGHPVLSENRREYARQLTDMVQSDDRALSTVASHCDKLFNLPEGSFLTLAYHLIATRCWTVDLHQELNPAKHVQLIRVNLEE